MSSPAQFYGITTEAGAKPSSQLDCQGERKSYHIPMQTASSANGEYFWFLNTLVRVRISANAGPDATCVIEHWAPPGDSPPLHIHRNEDEIFYILGGECRFRLEGSETRAGSGDSLIVPKGARHTYRVESTEGHFLTVTRGSDFERFVRVLGRPAERIQLPPQSGPPTAEAIGQLTSVAAAHGIDLCGPPLQAI